MECFGRCRFKVSAFNANFKSSLKVCNSLFVFNFLKEQNDYYFENMFDAAFRAQCYDS